MSITNPTEERTARKAVVILSEMRRHAEGMTRTEIRALVGGDVPAEQIDASLHLLARYELAIAVREHTGGRPVERWRAAAPVDGGVTNRSPA